MAMHMFRRCIQNSLRFSTLYRQTTRQVSCLANRCVFSVNTLNSRVFLVEKSLIKPVASSLRCFSDAPTLSVAELEERTLEVIQKFDKVEPDKVTLDAHFINDMGLDSLDVVDILMAFEDEFGVEISDENAEKIFTPKDAVEFMKSFLDIQDH